MFGIKYAIIIFFFTQGISALRINYEDKQNVMKMEAEIGFEGPVDDFLSVPSTLDKCSEKELELLDRTPAGYVKDGAKLNQKYHFSFLSSEHRSWPAAILEKAGGNSCQVQGSSWGSNGIHLMRDYALGGAGMEQAEENNERILRRVSFHNFANYMNFPCVMKGNQTELAMAEKKLVFKGRDGKELDYYLYVPPYCEKFSCPLAVEIMPVLHPGPFYRVLCETKLLKDMSDLRTIWVRPFPPPVDQSNFDFSHKRSVWEKEETIRDFLRPLTEEIISKYHVDTNRVYVVGESLGGGAAMFAALMCSDLYTHAIVNAPTDWTYLENRWQFALKPFWEMTTEKGTRKLKQLRIFVGELDESEIWEPEDKMDIGHLASQLVEIGVQASPVFTEIRFFPDGHHGGIAFPVVSLLQKLLLNPDEEIETSIVSQIDKI